MAGTKDYGLGEFTYPRGWFMVADAAELTDKPLPLKFFGQDFALYRGKSGKIVLLDAFCPHMGTHLAKNTTSYVTHDGQIEGDSIRCPYHGWRFGADGKCNEIPFSSLPIPKAACVRSWPVVERLGAVFVWHDPEGGEPEWDAPDLAEWNDAGWVRHQWDHLGQLKCHQQEIIDNIADCTHLQPVHGSIVNFFENEFRGHLAIQRQGGPHRTLVTSDGKSPILITDTVYHGPGVLLSRMSGTHDAVILIMHTSVEDGTVQVWHALMVKSPSGAKPVTAQDTEAARMYQAAALGAFSQDFEVWSNKRACINGMFLPSDGAFRKARIWYRQFYNPRAKKDEFLKQAEGVYVPAGMKAAPEASRGSVSLADAVAAENQAQAA